MINNLKIYSETNKIKMNTRLILASISILPVPTIHV